MAENIYAFSARTPTGREISLDQYAGKVLLVVNTATKCGLAPQFEGLEKLYQDYRDKGLVVLGFPCNQFAGQEPESNDTMVETCKVNFGVTFPLFAKIDVNGTGTHPVFKYLKSQLGGLFGQKIKWNFTKFLVDAHGRPVRRYAPITKPEALQKDIERELAAI